MEVKLVHGEFEKSVDHAWISVLNAESGEWVSYDLTQDNPTDMPTHIEKTRADSWDDIRDLILDDHKTLRDRRLVKEDSTKKG